jgi:hypothetical protein
MKLFYSGMKKKKSSPKEKLPLIRTVVYICGIVIGILVISAYPAYLIGQNAFNRYFDRWGNKLVELEKRGLLSKKFGAAWQDIIKEQAMEQAAHRLLGADTSSRRDTTLVVDGVSVNDYPSLSIIAKLNAVQNYSNEIRITDRRDRDIARIRTNHLRAKISEFPPALITALVAAEDGMFWKNKTGVEYGSIVRSVLSGVLHSAATFSFSSPRGTSTITQQVAKLFISDIDAAGHRRASKTMDRKLREMRLASALRKMYKPEEILEVYVNHCITSDNGLIGCKDIARALFDKDLKDLSDAQCVYLARSVKWGRNVKSKIIRQCGLDMPRIGKAMKWDAAKQKKTLVEIQSLTFKKLRQIATDFGPLVDCANEFWLQTLRKNGASDNQCADMNIVDPNSLIRKKGNLIIRLSIDLALQRELEKLVNARGFGPDSVALMSGKPILISGQYFAYSIMDSKSGRLLAYFSKDRIGSRLSGLMRNRTPNGSSTAKPIFNALMFDLGVFQPYTKWNDSVEVREDVPWQRAFRIEKGKVVGALFLHSAVRGKAYEVHNHGDVFYGCQYVFDQLNVSNNILGVETVYRLNRKLFNLDGSISKEAFSLVQFFYRIGAFDRIKDELGMSSVTGVRVYKELARIAGVEVDSAESGTRHIPISDSLYSVALGTLELTLYEQMHLFNVLYDNDLIDRPADHQSLVLDNIVLNGDTVDLNDTIKRCHPFGDLANLRPTYLGMHKRLAFGDGLDAYDIAAPSDSSGQDQDAAFDPAAFPLPGPASNFAKSGTTDDVIKPFNKSLKSGKKTNYGVWNAVIRVDMSKFGEAGSAPDRDIRDITIACIGECNEKFTGPRDGKTLHKFLTKGLLLRAGVTSPNGYFGRYESYIKRVTPKDMMDCGSGTVVGGPAKSGNPFQQFLSIFKKRPDTTVTSPPAQGAGDVSKNQD